MRAFKNEVTGIIENLWGAFTWDDAPQGHEYWAEVVKNLQAIVDHAEDTESKKEEDS